MTSNQPHGYAFSVETLGQHHQEQQTVLAYNGLHQHLRVKADTKYCLHLHNNTDRDTYVKVTTAETHLGTWLLKARTSMKLSSCHQTNHQLVFDSNTFATFQTCVEDKHRYHTSAITAVFLPAKANQGVCRVDPDAKVTKGLWVANCDEHAIIHQGVIVTLPILLKD